MLSCSVLAITMGLLGAQGAMAQVSPNSPSVAPSSEEIEDAIVVTGTRIQREGFESPSPVQVVGAAEISSFGATQLQDVLTIIPSNTGSRSFTEQENGQGTVQFNLRGLGYSSTLTLLNGRRAGVSPFTDATGGNYVDINQFPLAMIQRIEVLKDGASAIYGSEAVAGVVNLITRKGFEGLEVSGGYENARNEAASVNLVFGAKSERATFNLYATYYTQTRTLPGEFEWLRERLFGDGDISRAVVLSGTGNPGTIARAGPDPNGGFRQVTGARSYPDADCLAAGGIFRTRPDGTVDSGTCRFNIGNQQSLVNDEKRLQAFAEVSYELLNSVTLFNETSFSTNVVRQNQGPQSFSNGSITNSGNVLVPSSHPFNFYIADPASPQRLIYIGPDAWNPAIHTAADLSLTLRPLGDEFTGRNAPDRRSEHNYLRVLNGADVALSEKWRAELAYQYAQATNVTNVPDYRADALNSLIATGAFNPFGTSETRPTLVSPKDRVSMAGNSQDVINQFLVTENFNTRTSQHVVDFAVDGELGDFGFGAIGIASGAQYRHYSLSYTPDALRAAGEDRSPDPEFGRQGSQDVWAVFAEMLVPYNDFGQLQVAVRHENYGGNVGSSTDPKIAARVNLTKGVALRASFSTSFQAPTVNQTTTSLSRDFINDPATQTASGLVCSATGVNSNPIVAVSGDDSLEPQSSRNFAVGTVITPTRGLRVSVDLWQYRYKNLIAAGVPAQAIVDADCADDGVPNDPRVVRSGAGGITRVNTAFENIGRVNTRGLDIGLVFNAPVANIGKISVFADATYVDRFRVDDGESATFEGARSRNFTNNFFPIPQWRATAGARLQTGVHSVAANVRYIDGYKNDQSNNSMIKSQTTVDLQYGLTLANLLRRESSIALGVDNVFDVDPPALRRADAVGNILSDPSMAVDRPGFDPLAGHHVLGRTFYVRLRQLF